MSSSFLPAESAPSLANILAPGVSDSALSLRPETLLLTDNSNTLSVRPVTLLITDDSSRAYLGVTDSDQTCQNKVQSLR